MLESFSAWGASPPGTPYRGVAPGPHWGPRRPPAQLEPMEISADGPSAHQQKFPTISLIGNSKLFRYSQRVT